MSYIQLTSPLILHADPVLPGHAVTKQYVDNKKVNLNASWFSQGSIDPTRLPALGGDVSSGIGSGVLTLNVNGATAGTYPKVTIDATGRVVSGTILLDSDITSVSWNKITSGKPTTAAGYGITNLISLSGGTSSGPITSTGVPTAPLHAVTKGYVDNAITEVVSAGLDIGDIVRKPIDYSSGGFLRCNGGEVSKTTYANLYAVIGDRYNVKEINGHGRPWELQHDLNESQSADITGWASTAIPPHDMSMGHVVVTKNKVHLLGGIPNTGGPISDVYTANIDSNGVIGTWFLSGSLSYGVYKASVIVTKNRVYLIGGMSGAGSVAVSSVQTASINSDGSLGVWTITNSLPSPVFESSAFLTKNRAFIVAYNNTSLYTAIINSDGTLGNWSLDVSGGALSGRSPFSIVIKNKVYIFPYQANATTNIATINSDGTLGNWSSNTNFTYSSDSRSYVVTKNKIYVIGGNNYDNGVKVLMATVNIDGTIGSWSEGTSLPGAVINGNLVVTSSRIYLINAQSSTGRVSYYANFAGGLNDYSAIYNNLMVATDPVKFRLPDLSTGETSGLKYYIKY